MTNSDDECQEEAVRRADPKNPLPFYLRDYFGSAFTNGYAAEARAILDECIRTSNRAPIRARLIAEARSEEL